MDLEYFTEPASWQFDETQIREVRTRVFIEEQQVPEEEEWDAHDATAQHFLASTSEGEAIGTARLTRDGLTGHIGRMAVLESWRGQGVGDSLLRAALEFAAGLGLTEIRLMAQTHALAFYRRHGFSAFGEVFDDVGIPHRWMKRQLKAPAPPQRRLLPRPAAGAAEKRHEDFEDRQGLTRGFQALISATRHELAIFTRTLEPRILDTPEMTSALRSLCTAGAPARVRVMIVDSRPAIAACHPWIALSQRLSSLIHFRRPGKDHRDYPCAFGIADENHLLFRPFGDQYPGYFQQAHRREARRMLEFFDEAWGQGDDDPYFRRLAL